MTLPVGVPGVVLSAGPYLAPDGTPSRPSLRVALADRIVHVTTGTVWEAGVIANATADTAGVVAVTVPRSNAPGYVDSAGRSITGWRYIVTVSKPSGSAVYVVAPVADLDLDLLLDLNAPNPETGEPLAYVQSVAGLAGDVDASELATALQEYLDVAAPELPPGTETTAGAQVKATAAYDAAVVTAAQDATAKANAARTDAVSAAATDATAKADAARTAAVTAAATDAASKVTTERDRATTAEGALVAKAGSTMTGPLILAADPTNALGAATRQYVLAQVAALVGAAPAELDTFLEVFQRFTTDEGALTALAGVVSGKQPLDDDLTAIAGLVTTSVGRSLLTIADAAAGRSIIAAASQAALAAHLADTNNPHATTKAQLGLGNVPNVDTSTLANVADSTANGGRLALTTAERAAIAAAGGGASPAANRPAIVGHVVYDSGVAFNNGDLGEGVWQGIVDFLPAGTYDAVVIGIPSAGSAGAVARVVAYADTPGTGPTGAPVVNVTAAATSGSTYAVITLGTPLVWPGGLLWRGIVTQGGATTRPSFYRVSGMGATQHVALAGQFVNDISPVAAKATISGTPPTNPTITWDRTAHRVGFRRSA